ncbi:MAG: NADP-dependent oxidoreductase [Kiloniellales bacterium]
MTDAVNHRIVLKARPTGGVAPELFELQQAAVPQPGPGQMLIRLLYLSLDPAMRGWIADAPSYREPVALGAVMPGWTVGEVTASRHPDFDVGEIVAGRQGWQEWALSDGSDIDRKVDPAVAPVSTALHVLGHTGLTAYVGLLDIGEPRSGETVVVSTAAGAVGSMVGQIAKLSGCRTVGLTGTDAKVKDCRERFGYDVAINYRTAGDLDAALREACPDGIDVYFDNVGGSIADAVLGLINVHARIVICGTIGTSDPIGPRPNRQLLVKRARMEGFLVFDHMDRLDEAVAQLGDWLGKGLIHYREDVTDGLAEAPAALVRLLAGQNSGKVLIRLARDAL